MASLPLSHISISPSLRHSQSLPLLPPSSSLRPTFKPPEPSSFSSSPTLKLKSSFFGPLSLFLNLSRQRHSLTSSDARAIDSDVSIFVSGVTLPSARSELSDTVSVSVTADGLDSSFVPGFNPDTDMEPNGNGNGNGHVRGKSEHGVATVAVHGGERKSRPNVSDSLTTPIVQTSTYFFKDTAELIAFQEGSHASFEYGRYGNPTTSTVEEKISLIEGAEETLLSTSGMCSATTMLLAIVPSGGHIVTTTDCYRRTRQFIQTVLPKMGITTTVIDPSDMAALERALNQNKVSLFFSESPTNPYLRCIDIELVSKMCHAKGALVCIDCTFATPINQKAIALGADMVLHSATKYLAGHNDVLAGTLSGSRECLQAVRALHNVLGGVVDPHAAYLILRGIKTLDLRVRRQNESALKLAQALEAHHKVARVHYPGLESHPEHHIARKQMTGFGGVVSFEIDGDLKRTSNFIDNLRIPYIAPSLGGCESLVEQPTIISYWDYGPSERARLGIKDNLVRFSCGIESYEDIHADVMQALDAI